MRFSSDVPTPLVIRYRFLLLGSATLLAVLAFITIEAPKQDWYFQCLKWLGLPTAVLVFLFAYVNREFIFRFYAYGEYWKMWSGVIFFCFAASFLMPAYVLLVNTLHIQMEPVVYQGAVVSKNVSGKKRTYTIDIQDDKTAEIITLVVRDFEYSQIKVGSQRTECFQRGWLGIPFRYRYSASSNICAELR